MTRTAVRRLALALVAAPAVLALAACGGDKTDGAAAAGAPIAKTAPPAGKAWSDVVSKTPEGGYVMGNPNAPIKLVEFASLTCSHCAEFAAESFTELRDNFVASGRVSYEMRNFVRDGIDMAAAQLTRCGAPESYFALTEQAFAYQEELFKKAQAAGDPAFQKALTQPADKRGMAVAELLGLPEYFAARGISRDQATTCLADTKSAEALAAQTQADAEKLKITGTPTFIINGEKQDANTWKVIKARLEGLGAR